MLITAIILMFVVFVALISRKLNIPLILIAMAMGIFFGSDVTGIIYFDDAQLTQRVANVALVFILFAGGFSTKTHNIKPVFEITLLLATGGVLVTALVAAVPFAALTGFGFQQSLLLCVIISSTDAAAIFSILRTRSINKTLTSITEIESAANDPMAIISTVSYAVFSLMRSRSGSPWIPMPISISSSPSSKVGLPAAGTAHDVSAMPMERT